MQLIDPTTLALVSRALDAGALRHQAIAQNIANANIAGAHATRVRFEELLAPARAELDAGRPVQSTDVPSAELVQTEEPIALDAEMSALSSNGLHYQALLRAMNRHLSLMQIAVSEGRR